MGAESGAVEELWAGGELKEYHQDSPDVWNEEGGDAEAGSWVAGSSVGVLKDEVQGGVVMEDCRGVVRVERWCVLGTVLTERLGVPGAGLGLEPWVSLREILADREDESVDGRGVVMVGEHTALVGETGEVKTAIQWILAREKNASLVG